MKKRTRIILWISPIIIIFLEIFVASVGMGMVIPWKPTGKLPEGISKIVGVHQNKIYILTDSGEFYSLEWSEINIPTLAQWAYEKELPTGHEPPCLFTCAEEGGQWAASPPLFLPVKQIYQFEVMGEGGTLVYKFALAADGSIWYWERGFGIEWELPFLFILLVEFLGYLLALMIGFIVFLVKKIKNP